ncbi:MAG: gluconeogenesis factor YvcK family protein [Sarcina sp.]
MTIEECNKKSNYPNIVAIGGGTGLSTMLRGLKNNCCNITAIVTVADDGGGSGMLREDLGMLPPGDVRNCILALSNTEPILDELLNYRFKDGMLKGQNFGNLFLAAMNGISINFQDAIQNMSSILAVAGKVLPVTLDEVQLEAELENGLVVRGESNIPEAAIKENSRIKDIRIIPKEAEAVGEALEAIREADVIVLGPGSLYTSIIPNLLVEEIAEELSKTSAKKLYICNVMTQPGETTDFLVSDHIKEIYKYCGEDSIDAVIANVQKIDEEIIKKRYNGKNSRVVHLDREEVEKLNVKIIEGDLVNIRYNYIRHDANNLSKLIMKFLMENQNFRNNKK